MDNLEQALLESENSLMLLSDEELITPINDILIINPETRLIEVPDTELLLGVFSENLVEKKYFKCPRIVLNNIDLYECFIFINYVSASGRAGYIQSENVELDETEQYILFDWDLTNNVFDKNKDSTIYFSVSAKQYLEDSEPVFATRKAQGKMYETVNGTEHVTKEHADIILQILAGMKTKVDLPKDEDGNLLVPEEGQTLLFKEDGTTYYGTPSSGGGTSFSGSAKDVTYDDTETKLGAENVQDAIGKLSEEIVNLNSAEGDTVEEALEWLKTNGDTTKAYMLPDGFLYSYEEVEEDGTSYTNRLPQAINSDGSEYVGTNGEDGYKVGYRVSSSGEEKELAKCRCTGFISVKQGDVVRVDNFTPNIEGYGVISFSNASFSVISQATLYTQNSGVEESIRVMPDENGLLTFTVTHADAKYFRLTADMIDDTTIITVNEEITTDDSSVVRKWRKIDGSDNTTTTKPSLMFISPDGNDSNSGLTADKPKKTVKACVNSGATRISAKRGVYNEIVVLSDIGELEIFPTDNNKTYVVGEKREPIVFETVDYITSSSLATYNSIKRVAYSNSANTQFDKVFTKQSQPPLVGTGYGSRYNSTIWLLSSDEKTVCIKLKPVLTVAECEAETNTFTYVDGYIYINANLTNVEKVVVPTNWDSGFYVNGANKLILKEVEVRFSGTYNIDVRNCAFFDFYKCACKYTSYGSGFHPFNSNGIMNACYATKNFDGYGISGYGHTTYIDCVSEFNFDDGMSHHDGSKGTVIGGRYEGNGKGGNTPAYGAEVNIYGGLYKDNAEFGIGYLYTSEHKPAYGIISGATMIGNKTGLVVQANCPVTMISCLLKDNTTERDIDGILTEYTLPTGGNSVGSTTEDWVFTLEDGSTVTKKVVLA